GDHSSRPMLARRLQRPYPRDTSGPLTLLFGLAPGGVWHARAITRAPVGSYPTVSPLPEGGLFSVPLSADRSAPPLTATLPCGARTFLFHDGSDRPTHSGPYNISSAASARIRTRPARTSLNVYLIRHAHPVPPGTPGHE